MNYSWIAAFGSPCARHLGTAALKVAKNRAEMKKIAADFGYSDGIAERAIQLAHEASAERPDVTGDQVFQKARAIMLALI